MTSTTVFRPQYESSLALIIGVNDYEHVPPLSHARQDAEALSGLLIARFGFVESDITLLLDGEATRSGVMSAFLRFSETSVSDDRVIMFFAGHGHTRAGRRGDVGYLVPADGDPGDLSTLIRWDDLTGSAELIPAKHVLFLMDACYGGLAITRALPSGSSRFLKDMLLRYSRQVLTAGKADEVVADSGGPRPGHSMFTGHLLNALDGAVATSDGIISANAVMAYVYDQVAKDPYSSQSPHYGYLDGDGDLIFEAPNLGDLTTDDTTDSDVLIQVPATASTPQATTEGEVIADQVKDFLSDPRDRIRLDDLVTAEIRVALHETREEEFPSQTDVTPEDFASRLRRYEAAMRRLMVVTILVAKWGNEGHQETLAKTVTRLADNIEPRDGRVIWLGFRWYPITLLMYAGGIAALSAQNYRSLSTLLNARVGTRTSGSESEQVIVPAVDGMLDVQRADFFKGLPGHERQYAPKSEYLFKTLQLVVEDSLFLGKSYEDFFDRFEIFFALVYATSSERRSGWGPPGRFAWKHRGSFTRSPYTALVEEAEQQGADWPPLTYGLFDGSSERFSEIAAEYRQLIDKLGWF